MPANIRYRSTYYNTTVTGTGSRTMKIEILDTEAVAGITNFQSVGPDESFEGLGADLRPGVYPSTFKFGMYLRSSPKAIQGVTYGVTDDILTDIITAPEGRFLVRVYIDDVLHFLGPMIYDQCSYSDENIPLLHITATDGLVRWGTTDYVSEVGLIVYYSTKDNTETYTNTPLAFDGPESTAWIVVEHRVFAGDRIPTIYYQYTTFARREMYSKNSPGTGWVAIGGGKWVKALTYTNEVEEEDLLGTPPYYPYVLTRDLDDDRHRTIAEFIKRAMHETALTDEYPDPDVMYDCSSEWYEHSMANFDDDPFTMERVHEYPFLDKTWLEGMQELCRLHNLRVYSAQGRYHVEQIPMRDNSTIKRWIYKADGTSAGAAETASLDLDFSALSIHPQAGGSTKFLAPFGRVEALINLDRSDLLEGVRWDVGNMGMKFLGSIRRRTGTQRMVIQLQHTITSTFDPVVLATLPDGQINELCKHTIFTFIQIRLTNKELGTVYYLHADGNGGVWDTTPFNFVRSVSFGGTGFVYSVEHYGYTRTQTFLMSSDDIPDPEDAMYDVHMSVILSIPVFDNGAGGNQWFILTPDSHWHILSSKWQSQPGVTLNSMRFYSDVTTDPFTESPDTIAQEKTYYRDNDLANTIKVRVECQWADTNQFEKQIQIWNGTIWVASKAWSILGAGDPMEILELLAHEIMSLRQKPRRLYSGAFVSALPSADSRLLRGTTYYLPLSCSRDTGYDTFKGDFLEIARTAPPAGGIIGVPYEGSPQPGLTGIGDDNPEDDAPDSNVFTLETNEAITAGSTLTEVDIINTANAFIQSGTNVTIKHPTTGVQEVVVLTQDIDPADTVMHFASHVFGFSYPDASYIIAQLDDGLFPTSLAQVWYFFKANYSATEIHAPDFTFMDEESTSPHVIAKKYKVRRNGIRIYWNQAPGSSPQIRKSSYHFDSSEKKWKFWIPLADETIEIEATR